jgi:hypothetical protein
MTHQGPNRFINNNLPTLQQANHHTIFNYEGLPLLTLEKAVEKIIPIIPHVMNYVATAKEKCNCVSTLLTREESAAIYLYTMSTTEFFSSLNIALRNPNRQFLKPWLHFLKLLITALKKLPSTKDTTIWRAVNYNATSEFVEGEVYTYWYISSCSKNISSVRPFLGESGTLFTIKTIDGKDVSQFSAVPDEEEVILMPGTCVRVKGPSFDFIERLFIIDLEQINSQT